MSNPATLDRFSNTLVAVWEIWLCFSTIMLLVGISLLMVPAVRQQPKWSIGNIIAVAVWVPVFINWLHMLKRKHQLLRLLSHSKTNDDSKEEIHKKRFSTKFLPNMLLRGAIAQNTATFAQQTELRCIPLRISSRVKLLYFGHSRCNRRSVVHLQELYKRTLLWRTFRTPMWPSGQNETGNLLLRCLI